jgi:hypothetical protein
MYSESNIYASLWNKYRPAILKLMLGSEKDTQQYKLSAHEFKAVNPREKTYAFSMAVSNGKAVSNIKGSAVARDLLVILQQSQKASQLTREAVYELSMDKQFVFSVSRKIDVVEAASVPE